MATLQDRLIDGIGHHQAGRLDQAAAIYRAILDDDPGNPDALHLLGVVLFRQGDLSGAITLIGEALVRNPYMSQAHYNQANVLRTAGRADEAVAAYRQTITLTPGATLGRMELADTLKALGREGEAAAPLAELVALNPDDARLAFLLGEALMAAGQPEEAAAAFRQAIILVPDHAEAHRLYTLNATEVNRADAIAATIRTNRERAARGETGPAPNIYLKAYSRPFYLDRTIQSIKRHVSGYGRIIVLNDGLDQAYMERVRQQHPDIEIRTSAKVAGGVIAAPANTVFNRRKKFFRGLDFFDPARFWWQEIVKDPNDYIVVVDEDCWFFRDLDLTLLMKGMRTNGTLGCYLMYEKEELRAERKAKHVLLRADDVGNGTMTEYHAATVSSQHWSAGYEIFPSTQSILLRDYWVNSYDQILHFTNEAHLNERALRLFSMLSHRVSGTTMTAIDGGALRHSTSSTSRSDAGGKGCLNKIDPDLYHDAVSELWFEGKFDPMADFPHDYTTERLVDVMRGRIGDDKIQAWIEWRTEFLKMFYWL